MAQRVFCISVVFSGKCTSAPGIEQPNAGTTRGSRLQTVRWVSHAVLRNYVVGLATIKSGLPDVASRSLNDGAKSSSPPVVDATDGRLRLL